MPAHQLTRSAALALVAVALVVPAAAAQHQDLRSPDAREAARSAPASARQDLRSPDTRDQAAGRGTASSPDVVVVKLQPSAAADHGTAWREAGLGAALLVIIAIGCGYAITRRRTVLARPGRALSALAESTRDWRRGFGL
jgi:hypothetical protein